ncbi:MAG: hypothetical protein Fur0021_32850 [Candidatus Promineifilaceae bacterium]
MASSDLSEQQQQTALSRLLHVLSSTSSLVAAGAAAGAIYSLYPGDTAALMAASPILANLVAIIGGDVLADMLLKVARQKDASPAATEKTVAAALVQREQALARLSDLPTKRELYRVLSLLDEKQDQRWQQLLAHSAAHGTLLQEVLQEVRRLQPAERIVDRSTAPDPALAAAWQRQQQALLNQIKPLLFLHIWSINERQALLTDAFYPAHLWVLEQINIDGTPADFLPHCWHVLAEGAADGSLITLLLHTLKARYGGDRQAEIDGIAAAWRQLCAVRPPAAAPVVTGATPRRGIDERQPVLFLSYADADAPVAAQLQVDLAALGHACWTERAPQKGDDAWQAATAAGLGRAYAVLLLLGSQTGDDPWQRVEYLAALDRQKPVIPIQVRPDVPLPAYWVGVGLASVTVYTKSDAASLEMLRRCLPPPPPPGRHTWIDQTDALRPRLAELLYMDRLKLAELQHVAQYTPLSGHSAIQRTAAGRLRLSPVVARQEYAYTSWQWEQECPVETRRFADAVAELQTIRRAVLLGDPGSGKTTTLYKLAADLIDAALADPAAPIPLMIRLGLWTDAAESLFAFLQRSLGVLGPNLESRLASGQAALLLDGLNEIPAAQQAAKYRQVDDFLAHYPHLATWVSCREQDYPPDRALRLDRVTVTPLDAVRIQAFIHNYLDALPDFGATAAADLFWQLAGAAAQDSYDEFMAAVGAKLAEPFHTFWLDDQLPDGLEWGYKNWGWQDWRKQRSRPASLLLLATNPYMLFMLLQVYQDKRAVPANRGQLFDWFVERLLLRERFFTWDAAAEAVIRLPDGEALLAGLTKLAYAMQRQRGGDALTALPLAAAAAILNEKQRYQAASANLLALGDEVRFTHQLLQEYFVARAMRQRIFAAAGKMPTLRAADVWRPDRWWEPTNWEEAVILLAGLYSDDCTPVLLWAADANPEVAARCIVESGARTPEETKLRLRHLWLPRLADVRQDPDARARAAVGRALGRLTLADGTPLDNRPGVGFIVRDGMRIPDIAWGEEVPAGRYTLGGNKKARNSFDEQTITIPHPYRLSRYPVTCAQFDCFVTAPDFDRVEWWEGLPPAERQIPPPYFPPYTNSPRETVSWYQAVAFCRWLSHQLGYQVTLPHEYEWETAARYPDNRFYPWGNEFDPTKANTSEGEDVGQPSAVGIYPQGANQALNLYDLSGNVWEWCRNRYDKPDGELDIKTVDISDSRRVLRGGAWVNSSYGVRATDRNVIAPASRSVSVGFRLVCARRPPSH